MSVVTGFAEKQTILGSPHVNGASVILIDAGSPYYFICSGLEK